MADRPTQEKSPMTVLKETVLNLERVAEEAERALRRAREQLEFLVVQADEVGE